MVVPLPLYNMDAQKAKVTQDFNRAFSQITEGCGRPVCFNKDCFNCPSQEKHPKAKAAAILAQRFARSQFPMPCPVDPIASSGPADVRTVLMTTFQNLDILGAYFLERDVDGDYPGYVTAEYPGIDRKALREMYDQAQELVAAGKLAEQWLSQCLSCIKFTDYTSLFLPRAALILLEIPDLMQPEMREGLERVLQLITTGENQETRETMARWLSNYSGNHLLQLIYPIQQYITVLLCEDKHNIRSEKLVTAIEVLDIIQTANKRYEKVSYKEFYNDAVNKEVDLREQFVNWKQFGGLANQRHQQDMFSVLYYPWLLDSSTKAELLQLDTSLQQRRYMTESLMEAMEAGQNSYTPFLVLDIRRDNIVHDALARLLHGERTLKKPLKIHFVNEEGVDGGGLQKEFFQLIVKELFDEKFGMFQYYEDTRMYWFNPDTLAQAEEFELIGLVLGLAIYNSNILDVHLPLTIYKKLLGYKTNIEDLAEFNPQLARGLKEVLVMEGDVETMLCRTFDVETNAYDSVMHHPLKPEGSAIPVTNANREEYVQLYVDWVLNKSAGPWFDAFQRGFLKVCGGELLSMFRPEELELLVCGNPVLDFTELERVCVYEDGYVKDSRACRMLWKVLHSLTEEQKKRFLFFVTGSDRAPINGLGSLRFVISRNGPDSERLMTAHTCFNHLLLPEYSSEEKIRRMLLVAISNAEGFGLR